MLVDVLDSETNRDSFTIGLYFSVFVSCWDDVKMSVPHFPADVRGEFPCLQSVVPTTKGVKSMCVFVARASRPLSLLGIVAFCLFLAGCSSERKPANELKVVPVTGVVLVDGEPTAGIKIMMFSKATDPEKRAFPRGVTDEEGRFHAWTYRVNDGVPPGEYVVTYVDHSQANPAVRENPDGFQGRYSDRNSTEHRVTVPDSDEPFDMGEISLSRP